MVGGADVFQPVVWWSETCATYLCHSLNPTYKQLDQKTTPQHECPIHHERKLDPKWYITRQTKLRLFHLFWDSSSQEMF